MVWLGVPLIPRPGGPWRHSWRYRMAYHHVYYPNFRSRLMPDPVAWQAER